MWGMWRCERGVSWAQYAQRHNTPQRGATRQRGAGEEDALLGRRACEIARLPSLNPLADQASSTLWIRTSSTRSSRWGRWKCTPHSASTSDTCGDSEGWVWSAVGALQAVQAACSAAMINEMPPAAVAAAARHGSGALC